MSNLILTVLVYGGDNIWGGTVHTIKENAEAVIVASKEIGLEVNADKTKDMVMSRGKSEGRSHSMKIDNTCKCERFRIFGNNFNKCDSRDIPTITPPVTI
jgi:hypothetical protein